MAKKNAKSKTEQVGKKTRKGVYTPTQATGPKRQGRERVENVKG